MIWLCEELEYAADKGYVIKLNEESEIYRALAEKSRIKIPRSFIIPSLTFKEKLLRSLGNEMDCVQSFEGCPSERLSLLIRTKYAISLYPNWLMRVLKPPIMNNGNIRTTRGYFFLSLVHVALKLRGSLVSKV